MDAVLYKMQLHINNCHLIVVYTLCIGTIKKNHWIHFMHTIHDTEHAAGGTTRSETH